MKAIWSEGCSTRRANRFVLPTELQQYSSRTQDTFVVLVSRVQQSAQYLKSRQKGIFLLTTRGSKEDMPKIPQQHPKRARRQGEYLRCQFALAGDKQTWPALLLHTARHNAFPDEQLQSSTTLKSQSVTHLNFFSSRFLRGETSICHLIIRHDGGRRSRDVERR